MSRKLDLAEKRRRQIAQRMRYRKPSIDLIRSGKNKPCVDCGRQYHWFAMDYDHIPERGKKLFNVSQANCRNVVALAAEIAKCDVVCSNCHRIRTFTRRQLEALNL